MLTLTRNLMCGLLFCWLGLPHAVPAQNFFTDPIPKGMRVGISDFAVVPDSNNAPARLATMTQDASGRLFANDQRGQLYQISSDGSSVNSYLDISSFSSTNLNTSSGERGFQSFAFHPDFFVNGSSGFGKLYTIHSSTDTSPTADFSLGAGNSLHTVVSEWTTADPNAATFSVVGGAPREILRFGQPFGNHNGGQIAFNTSVGQGNADRGNLYIGLGDGGDGGDPFEAGQTTSNPFGAVLRIDPLGTNSANGAYGIVADNQFASDNDGNTLAEIYAFGFRNPQRFGWDSQNGNLFLADIGQNAVEEIDLVINGGNYGWDEREGSFQFEGDKTPGMIDPVTEYDHTNLVNNLPTNIGNRAITVGDVFRGDEIAGLNGKLLLGDFPTGLLFYLDVDNDALDGGQDGLRELVLVDDQNTDVRLLELINDSRTDRGLGTVSRADLRFSYGLDGQVYVLNKQDGVIRILRTVPEPTGPMVWLAIAVCGLIRSRRSRVN